eukprot:1146552-Pelagomonas_calceolata.AAC.3
MRQNPNTTALLIHERKKFKTGNADAAALVEEHGSLACSFLPFSITKLAVSRFDRNDLASLTRGTRTWQLVRLLLPAMRKSMLADVLRSHTHTHTPAGAGQRGQTTGREGDPGLAAALTAWGWRCSSPCWQPPACMKPTSPMHGISQPHA